MLFIKLGASTELSYTLVTLSLIFISAVLTAFGVYDNIARVAGAGTLVPVTGFANSVVSEALDTRSEGYVLGVGAKIFTVAGPVILYGTLCGMLYGIIYYFFGALI
jgi:stage V sporulation protein AC